MQIHVSFDYELFFGAASGSAQKCLLEPTERLMAMAKQQAVSFIFFVDAGYLYRLKAYQHIDACQRDYIAVSEQLRRLASARHEIALHIHPHWEDCRFEDGVWKIDTRRYKLADFSEAEIGEIVTKYHKVLQDILGKPCYSYRAGGWCIQPFEPIGKALSDNGITTDSTVYYKGFHASAAHAYDFRAAPNDAEWRFVADPCKPVSKGAFLEVPVTYDRIPPFFYWQLYWKMRSEPALYRPVGDGRWLADRKRVYRHFYTPTHHFACADGYFASRLKGILKRSEREERMRLMILSHPKSMAPYSFEALNEFITFAKARGHQFQTLAA